jgi:hypothetical protein
MAHNWDSQFKSEILEKHDQGSFIRAQPPEIRTRIHAQLGPVHVGQSLVTMLPVPQFGFAYIDGDHRWRSVVEDTKAVVKRIEAGGIVVWDDYGTATEVGRFIDTVQERIHDGIVFIPQLRFCYAVVTEGLRASLLLAVEDL